MSHKTDKRHRKLYIDLACTNTTVHNNESTGSQRIQQTKKENTERLKQFRRDEARKGGDQGVMELFERFVTQEQERLNSVKRDNLVMFVTLEHKRKEDKRPQYA